MTNPQAKDGAHYARLVEALRNLYRAKQIGCGQYVRGCVTVLQEAFWVLPVSEYCAMLVELDPPSRN